MTIEEYPVNFEIGGLAYQIRVPNHDLLCVDRDVMKYVESCMASHNISNVLLGLAVLARSIEAAMKRRG